MDRMNRRGFLRATTGGAAALAAAGASASALPLAQLAGLGTLASPADGSLVLFDARFPEARELAGRLATRPAGSAVRTGDAARDAALAPPGAASSLQAVDGDATALVQAVLEGSGPRRLSGVTTESVPFCLSQLSTRGARPQLTLKRLDRDLFAWQLVYPS